MMLFSLKPGFSPLSNSFLGFLWIPVTTHFCTNLTFFGFFTALFGSIFRIAV